MKVTWIKFDEKNLAEDSGLRDIGGMGGFIQHGHRWADYLARHWISVHPYLEAIRTAVLDRGLRESGFWHQEDKNGAPCFEDGTIFHGSMRSWGDLMAAIWATEENVDYWYGDFAWDVPDMVNVRVNAIRRDIAEIKKRLMLGVEPTAPAQTDVFEPFVRSFRDTMEQHRKAKAEAVLLQRYDDAKRVIEIVKRVRPFNGDLSGMTFREAELLAEHGFFGHDDEPESLREGARFGGSQAASDVA